MGQEPRILTVSLSPVSLVKHAAFMLAGLYSLIGEVLVTNGKLLPYLHGTRMSPVQNVPWLN